MFCSAITKDGNNCNSIIYDNLEKCKTHLKLKDAETLKKIRKKKAHIYYIENKEKINTINKQFYINNRQRYLKLIDCAICGSQICSMNLHQHLRTKKCNNFVKSS